MAQIEITLLGSFQVRSTGRPVEVFRYDKVRAMLAYLVVEGQRAHRRDELVGLFWPESSEEDARTSLRQALAHLRAAIGDEPAGQPYLLASRESVQWNRSADAVVDVLQFEEALRAARVHIHRSRRTCRFCARQLAAAVEHYQGDFLAHFFLPGCPAFEDWAALKREVLQRQALEALDQLAAYHDQRGEYSQAEAYIRRMLAMEPWQEEAHRRLMRLLVLKDQHAAALAQYEACRKNLLDALGVEPQPETTAFYEAIRAGEPAGESDAELLRTGHLRKHNLPAPFTPFIGRAKEMAEIQSALDQPERRLITIVGPGGVGKTRLAQQVGLDQIESFPDGVFFVPLAAVRHSDRIPAAIADALQLPLSGETEPVQQLLALIAGKEKLLILDNLEHLPGAGGLIRDLLTQSPRLVIVCTSRESLKVSGEFLFPLQGLPVHQPAGQENEREESASALFIQTALRRHPGLRFEGSRLAAVEHICWLLDGNPLGIELAAAWADTLSPEEIAQEIERNFDFLSSVNQDTPPRHASVRAVFDHSWQLLSTEEQAVFRKLAVFQGGFDRESAGRVAGASLQGLRALVDQSLVKRDGLGRYALHELVRQYAFEKLVEAGEERSTRDLLLDYFLDLAETAAPELEGERGPVWMRRIESEMENLRDAIQGAIERGQAKAGMRLVWALFRFWYWHNQHVREVSRWLEQLLALPGTDEVDPTLQGNILYAAGVMASMRRDIPTAEAYFNRSLAIREQQDDPHGRAAVLNSLGTIAFEQENYTRARTLFESSLSIRRALGQRPSVQLSNLAVVAQIQGDLAKAQEYVEESLRMDREDHNLGGIAIGLGSLARLLLRQGDRTRAWDCFLESLQLRRELGDQEGTAYALEGLATYYTTGEPGERDARQAVLLYSAASGLRQKIGVPLSEDEVTENQPFLDRAQAVLGEPAFRAAWERGSEMAIEDVIQAVLGGAYLA